MRGWLVGIALMGLMALSVANGTLTALEEAYRLTREARRAPEPQRMQKLERAKGALQPLSPEVRTALEPLLDDAKSNDEALNRALSTLETYRTVFQTSAEPLSREKVRQQVDALYAEPDMRMPGEPWYARLGRFFSQAIQQIFALIQRLLSGLGAGGGATGTIAQWLVIALLIALIGLLLSYVMSRYQTRPRRTARPSIDVHTVQDARLLEADEWHQLAEQLVKEGDLRGAVRALYLALLRLLSEHRLIAYDPARTNWEHLQQLRRLQDSTYYQALAPLTLRFDLLWYGGYDAEPSDYQQFEQVFNSLKRRVNPNARATA